MVPSNWIVVHSITLSILPFICGTSTVSESCAARDETDLEDLVAVGTPFAPELLGRGDERAEETRAELLAASRHGYGGYTSGEEGGRGPSSRKMAPSLRRPSHRELSLPARQSQHSTGSTPPQSTHRQLPHLTRVARPSAAASRPPLVKSCPPRHGRHAPLRGSHRLRQARSLQN